MALKNWSDGLPAEGQNVAANDSGTMKYWGNGLPSQYIFVGGTPPATEFGAFFLLF